MIVADQSEVVELLSRPESRGTTLSARRIDIHGAMVFLAGERAVKLKRAVCFGLVFPETLRRRGWGYGDGYNPL